MKITTIHLYRVKGRHWPRFPWIFIEIETDEGITGVGEALCYRSSGVYESLLNLQNYLKGKNPAHITMIWEDLIRRGMNIPAVSGIEIALWDLLGKRLNVPIHALVGGKNRENIAVYVDGFFRGADYVEDEYIQKALDAVAQGFTALKMDVDEPIPSGRSLNRTMTIKDMTHTINMVDAIRNAVGDTIKLAIDCHGAFNITTALELCRRLKPYNLMWVEDPVPQNNLKAMAKVTRNSEIPICTGELLQTRFEFRELFEREASDFIMPDIARTGGVAELLRIASYADTHYIPIAPHNMVGPIATIASVQACASIPNFAILEFQLGDVEWRDKILKKPIPIQSGQITVPHTPGLGIELNTHELEAHLIS